MKKQFIKFLIRWFANCIGLLFAASILNLADNHNNTYVIIVAGLVLSILNVVIKPILIALTLPAISFSLGLFMVIINGLIIFIVSELYKPFQVASFWDSILVGIIIGLVNYIVTITAEVIEKRHA